MHLQIHARGIEFDPALSSSVEGRVRLALSDFAVRVHRVVVRLSNFNGPRGGEDRSCRIAVSLVFPPRVSVEATGPDMETAVNRAANQVTRRVKAELDHRRASRAGRAARRHAQPIA